MKVVLIPGPRNEELIAKILEAKSRMDEDEWEEYMTDIVCQGDAYMDAMYYACENGNEMLEDQAEYFHERLLDDEKYYYAGRMVVLMVWGIDNEKERISALLLLMKLI